MQLTKEQWLSLLNLEADAFSVEERLEIDRAYFEGGANLYALEDAIRLCIEISGPKEEFYGFPRWLAEGVQSLVSKQILSEQSTGKRGPHGRKSNMLGNRYTDLVRYLMTVDARKRCPSYEAAFDEVKKALHGTDEGASADMIKKSYDKVRNDLKTPDGAMKYYPFWIMPQT